MKTLMFFGSICILTSSNIYALTGDKIIINEMILPQVAKIQNQILWVCHDDHNVITYFDQIQKTKFPGKIDVENSSFPFDNNISILQKDPTYSRAYKSYKSFKAIEYILMGPVVVSGGLSLFYSLKGKNEPDEQLSEDYHNKFGVYTKILAGALCADLIVAMIAELKYDKLEELAHASNGKVHLKCFSTYSSEAGVLLGLKMKF